MASCDLLSQDDHKNAFQMWLFTPSVPCVIYTMTNPEELDPCLFRDALVQVLDEDEGIYLLEDQHEGYKLMGLKEMSDEEVRKNLVLYVNGEGRRIFSTKSDWGIRVKGWEGSGDLMNEMYIELKGEKLLKPMRELNPETFFPKEKGFTLLNVQSR